MLLFYATLFACCVCDQESTPTGWRDGDARMHAVQLKNPSRNKGEDRRTYLLKHKGHQTKSALVKGDAKRRQTLGRPLVDHWGCTWQSVAGTRGETWSAKLRDIFGPLPKITGGA